MMRSPPLAVVVGLTAFALTICSSCAVISTGRHSQQDGLLLTEARSSVRDAVMDDLFWGKSWTPGGVGSTPLSSILSRAGNGDPVLQCESLVNTHRGLVLTINPVHGFGYVWYLDSYGRTCYTRGSPSDLRGFTHVEDFDIHLGKNTGVQYIAMGQSKAKRSWVRQFLSVYVQTEAQLTTNDSSYRVSRSFVVGPASSHSPDCYVLDINRQRVLNVPNQEMQYIDTLTCLSVDTHALELAPLDASASDDADRERLRSDARAANDIASKILLFGYWEVLPPPVKPAPLRNLPK